MTREFKLTYGTCTVDFMYTNSVFMVYETKRERYETLVTTEEDPSLLIYFVRTLMQIVISDWDPLCQADLEMLRKRFTAIEPDFMNYYLKSNN